jgi:hypothetical protein
MTGRSQATQVLLLLVVCVTQCSGTPDRSSPAPHRTAPPIVSRPPASAPSPAARTAKGTRGWRLSRPALSRQIEGYATASSGPPGVPVRLRISTRARSYDVRAYRIGAYRGGDGHEVWRSVRLPGEVQAPPRFVDREKRTVVAPWHTSTVVPTAGWTPGLYVFTLRASSGWQAQVPYVVRSPSSAGKVALVLPVTTWQAYNDWGGYSLYDGPAGDRRSWAVSFDRPYPAPGAREMAFGVVPVVVAAERLGVPTAYLTNVDVDADPAALRGARAYVSTGHDEYWTASMRDGVERARGAGTNLVFLGANTMYWRIRLESLHGRPGRVVVGYRSDAALDRAPPAERTGLWREVPPARAEHELTGMQYECFPVDAPFRIESPGWWGFAGTHVRRGQAFDHLVGVEADRVYPVPGTPRPMQVLAHTAYSCGGAPTSAQAVYYTTRSGAGVLNVGTLRWTCALVDRCPVPLSRRAVRFVNRVTATVLREFARGPAGLRHRARDNVGRLDLPSTNRVPAS